MSEIDKQADLAGPGIGNYDELEKILPNDYASALTRKETQNALFAAKDYIEENLCKELNLMMVQVPLIVDSQSGVNDYLDRDGSRTPIQFHITNDHDKNPIDAQVVQAATKWKRVALKQFDMEAGEGLLHRHARRAQGLLPRSRPQRLRRPVGLGAAITAEERNLDFLTDMVQKIWKVLKGAETHVQELFPQLKIGQVSRTCRTS